jgi:hypothetical protein
MQIWETKDLKTMKPGNVSRDRFDLMVANDHLVQTAAQQISGGSSNQQTTDDPSIQITMMPMISIEADVTIDTVI